MWWYEELFCILSLGFLAGGCYYFYLIFCPLLIYLSLRYHSPAAILISILLITLAYSKLEFSPNKRFLTSWIFRLWREYFKFEYDMTRSKFEFKDRKYVFLQFPHGVSPIGQFLACSIYQQALAGEMVCGIGADILFIVPIIRQVISWVGLRPASRRNISNIVLEGYHVAIIPGAFYLV